MLTRLHIYFGLTIGFIALPQCVFAQTNVMMLDTFIETHRIEDVSASWETVILANDFTEPVVVCTYVLPSSASNEAHTRIRNVSPSSFELMVQRFEDSSDVTASDVHCLVVEKGSHTLPNGQRINAQTVTPDYTNGLSVGWETQASGNVTSSASGFSNFAVLGQVMTFNDPQGSVFWTNNCANRNIPPTATAFCVGKHIGQINDTRLDETLGYIVLESGSGASNGVTYAFERGPDTILGTGNAPPYNYNVTGDFETAILTQAAEDGGQGGWAVLYGADPLPPNTIQLAIDEETVEGDMTRGHTTEEVYFSAFSSTQIALFSANKTVVVAPDSPTEYAIPGSDIIYTISIENTGDGAADLNSVFLVDSVPIEVEFFNGDMDGAGPATGPVLFEPGASGLTLSAADIGYSFDIPKPTSIAECDDIPAVGYVSTVRHICFSPKGYARPGTLYAGNMANVSFRMNIP